jgi:GPH family glycoside/pentoside/hexuronide:cation symporter
MTASAGRPAAARETVSTVRLGLKAQRQVPPPTPPTTPARVLIAYATPSLASSFVFTLVGLYLLKYSTDVLLISPSVMGLVFGLSRIWDAVTDPVMGHLTDRTRSRFGRRRPWMIAAAVPVGLGFLAIWSPPAWLDGDGLILWMSCAVILFYTATTAFGIPYTALGAELSEGYHDRTRIYGARAFADYVGVILAGLGLLYLEQAEDPRMAASQVAMVGAVGMIVGLIWPAWVLRERVDFQQRSTTKRPFAAFGDVLRNRTARLLLGVFFLELLGYQAFITLMPFMTEYLLETPGATAYYLFVAIGSTLFFIPIWSPLSRRFGKTRIWRGSLLAKAVLFACFSFPGAGDWLLIGFLTASFGIASGAGTVLGPSIQADVIDSDEARSGERMEGTFFAAWGLAMKLAVGCSIFVSGTGLAWIGFVPNAAQSEFALTGLRGLISIFPMATHIGAAWLLGRVNLDEQEYARIRAQIRERTELSEA